ncbi:MAG: hypothetical protein JSW46_08040 [Gemmatimonadota bacterium]|nr:MAG: hypothetical protein JSW46_08040 [Gemmatimonadota bacterium]
MVLALLRRLTPAGLLLASLAWLACSTDSDIAGPARLGEPIFAVTAGETYSWTTESGVTVTMQTLGALKENGQSQAFGINDYDVVVGQAEGPEYKVAFQWSPGAVMTRVGVDGDGWMATVAEDINDNGVIVGSGVYNFEFGVGFRWDGTDMMPLYSNSDGPAIPKVAYNDHTAFGQIWIGTDEHAVEWGPDRNIPVDVFGLGTNIHDANDYGDVVGILNGPKAFMWMNYPTHSGPSNEVEFGQLPNSVLGKAEGVNLHTQVVGYMWDPSHNRAFIWDEANLTKELPGLGDLYHTRAFDINDNELIVGESELPTGEEHAVAWINRQPIDLHPLITEATISTAQAVNNNGLIAGHVRIAGRWQAVAWTIEGDIGGGGGPLTPEEQLALLKDEIAGLAEAGVINGFQAWTMTRKVNVALRGIEAGWIRWAIFQLRLLVWQVNSLVDRGVLTSDQAEPLRVLAEGVIDGLSGG